MAEKDTTAVKPETTTIAPEATAPEAVTPEEAAPQVSTIDWQAELAALPVNGKRDYQQVANTVASRLEGFRGLFLRPDGAPRTKEEAEDIFRKAANGQLDAGQLMDMGIDAAKILAGSPFALADAFKSGMESVGRAGMNGGVSETPGLISSVLGDIWGAATNPGETWEELTSALSSDQALKMGVATAQALQARDGERAESDKGLGGLWGWVNDGLDFARGIWAHFNHLCASIPVLNDMFFAQYKGIESGEKILEMWKQEDDAKFVDEHLRKEYTDIPEGLISAVTGRATVNGSARQVGLPAYEAQDAAIGEVATNTRRQLGVADPGKSAPGSAFSDSQAAAESVASGNPQAIAKLAGETVQATAIATFGYGAVEGVARQTSGGRATAGHAAKLQKDSTNLLQKSLDDGARAKELRGNPSARGMLEPDAAKLQTRADTAINRATALDVEATAETARAEAKATKFQSGKLGSLATAATEELADKKGVVAKVTNVVRGPGRALGDVVGRLVEDSARQASQLVQAPAAAVAGFRAVPAVAADAGLFGNIMNFGAKLLGGGAELSAKLLKGVPLIGGVMNAGTIFLGSSPLVTAEYGRNVSYWEALDLDLKSGKITQEQHTYYRMMQAGDIGTGVGGFITMGVTDVAKFSLETADGKHVKRYLPASLLANVTGQATVATTPVTATAVTETPATQTAVNAQGEGVLGAMDPDIAAALTAKPAVARRALSDVQIEKIRSACTFTATSSVDLGAVCLPDGESVTPNRTQSAAVVVNDNRAVAHT